MLHFLYFFWNLFSVTQNTGKCYIFRTCSGCFCFQHSKWQKFWWVQTKNMYGKRKKSQSIYFVKLSGLAFQENVSFSVHILDAFVFRTQIAGKCYGFCGFQQKEYVRKESAHMWVQTKPLTREEKKKVKVYTS